MIQTMLFVAGMNTLLQTWFGTRLPVVIGGSFRFVVPMLYIALSHRYSFYFEPAIVCYVQFLINYIRLLLISFDISYIKFKQYVLEDSFIGLLCM